MRQSNKIAYCGMMAALSVVVMILGHILGLGLYISPMIAGLCLLPIGKKYGEKYQWMLWAVVSLLSFLMISEVEQNLMYLTLFGLYPILYPHFERLPRRLKWPCKLLYFNLVAVGVEALVMLLLVPEAIVPWAAVVMLVLGNAIFFMYDFIVPRSELLFRKYLGKFKR